MINLSHDGIFFWMKCNKCGKDTTAHKTLKNLEESAKSKGWIKVYYRPPGEIVKPPIAHHFCNNPCVPDGLIEKLGERVF